jgi:peptide/nickel transport system permease protein
MIAYLLRRLVVAVIVALGITVITFWLLHEVEPSPALKVLGSHAKPFEIAQWNRQHGYDRWWVLQLFTYIGHLVRGNFGYSYLLDQSVTALFKENAGRSAYLSGASLVLALIIAIPLGIYQAIRRNSLSDYSMTGVSFVLYSMPVFFLGVLLIQFFALDVHIFPTGVSDQITTTWGAITHPRQLCLPIVTLTLISVASFSRYMRSSALDALAEDYIRLARAKGLSQRAVLSRHLLRNACLPMITLVGLSIPSLLAGNLLIEVLFNYSGLGMLFYTALGNDDYNLLLAYVILGGILTVLGNLVADLAMSVADPRIRLG